MLPNAGQVWLVSESLALQKVTSEFQAPVKMVDIGQVVQAAESRHRIGSEYPA